MIRPLIPVVEAWIWSTATCIVLYFLLPNNIFTHDWMPTCDSGLFRDNFARRYDGRCSGWTAALTLKTTLAEVISWYAYVTIGFAVLRLHPLPHYIKGARSTLLLLFWLFILCGFVHLFIGYCNLHPLYNLLVVVEYINAVVSYIVSLRVAWALIEAFKIVDKAKLRVSEIYDAAVKNGLDIGPNPYEGVTDVANID